MENLLQLSHINYQTGAYITIEGKPDSGCFYIIQQGKVRITKETLAKGEEIEILGPGDFIGAVSAMSSHSQIETAQALSNTVLIKVFRNQYIGLIQKNSSVAIKIIMQFSRRLRQLNNTLARLTLNDTIDPGPPHLFNVGEYHLNHKQYEQAFYAYAKYLKYCPQESKAPFAKEKLIKLSSMVKNKKLDFEANQVNRIYSKNTMIFAEGEPGEELFVIQKGSVKIAKIVENKEVILAILKAGDIFGEMALLENKPRLASATAYTDCNVMVINKTGFGQMINSQPQLIDKVTTLLAGRIWFIYKKLANALMLDPVGRVYDAMLIQMERNRVPLDNPDPLASYIFDFGWSELLSLAGLPEDQGKQLMAKVLKNTKIQILENKIHVISIMELIRQTDYYRKMDLKNRNK